MKTVQLTNLKRTLEQFKKEIRKRLDSIDRVIKEIENVENTNEKRCPKCFGRDLRILVKGEMFCRACGYDSRVVKKGETK